MTTVQENPKRTGTFERNYPDLYDHVDALRDAGLLVEIDQEINKDTEMHPLVRWQLPRLPRSARWSGIPSAAAAKVAKARNG